MKIDPVAVLLVVVLVAMLAGAGWVCLESGVYGLTRRAIRTFSVLKVDLNHIVRSSV